MNETYAAGKVRSRSRFGVVLMMAILALRGGSVHGDEWTIRLDPSTGSEPASGRLILFFVTPSLRSWQRVSPIGAPFFSSPQPIASVAVERLEPGKSVTMGGSVFAFTGTVGGTLNDLHGPVRVQALLDVDNTERSHEDGPGNIVSELKEVELHRDSDDVVELTLIRVLQRKPLPPETDNLKWVEIRSEMLSHFYGRDVYHRAGVALPRGYADPVHGEWRWPAVYIVPGFGGRHTEAERYSRVFLAGRGVSQPPAVHIVLDPESPLGHHGFVDSPNNGPRGTALVKELIPYLESKFRLAERPEARIVTGHSSGGWSSLWLQLTWPEVFGACFSSAPDPIDFRAFQMTDIYADDNVFTNAAGVEQPSMRVGEDEVRMTVRQENLMEYAIDPSGRSGQQWDTWESMFSQKDASTGAPVQLFDSVTGEIRRDVAAQWRAFDMTKMVMNDWTTYGPIVTERVRLACGTLDTYYLNRAVASFKEEVERMHGRSLDDDDAPGYVLLAEGANHGSISRVTNQRWHREMREHLARHGLMLLED